MTTPRVEDIVANLRNLPSLPTVVMELLQTMDDEDVNNDRLAHGIANDQALAARTLRVANSPFYGMQGRIGTIAEAITVPGFVNVRSLVTTTGIATAWPAREAAGFEPRMFWRHGLGVACCASTLAQLAGDPQALVSPPEAAAWHRLGLGRGKLRTVLRRIESQFDGFSSIVS